jgi:hypothetical protein
VGIEVRILQGPFYGTTSYFKFPFSYTQTQTDAGISFTWRWTVPNCGHQQAFLPVLPTVWRQASKKKKCARESHNTNLTLFLGYQFYVHKNIYDVIYLDFILH